MVPSLVIMMVALIVLGPNKLPDAARQVGKWMAEFRKISGGFQREMREAMQQVSDPLDLGSGTTTSGPSASSPNGSGTGSGTGSGNGSGNGGTPRLSLDKGSDASPGPSLDKPSDSSPGDAS